MKSKIDDIYRMLEEAGEGNVSAKELIARLDELHLRSAHGSYHQRHLAFLEGMTASSDIQSLSDFLSKYIYSILGQENALTVVSLCYHNNAEFYSNSINGGSTILKAVEGMVAAGKLSLTMENRVEDISLMFENRLLPIESLYHLVHKSIPADDCKELEDRLNIHYFYGYPVSDGNSIIATISLALAEKLSEEMLHNLEHIIGIARQYFIMLFRYQRSDQLNRQMSSVFDMADFAFGLFESDGHLIKGNSSFNLLFEPLGNITLFDRKFQKSIGVDCFDSLMSGEEVIIDVSTNPSLELPLMKEYSKGRISCVKATEKAVSYYLFFLHSQKAEMRIRETFLNGEQKYQRIFNHIQDVYFEVQLDGTIIEISPSINNYISIPREKLIGKNIIELYKDSSQREEYLKILQQKGRVDNYHIDFQTPEGKVINTIVFASIVDNGTENERIVGSMIDVSEQVIQHQIMKESEIKFRSLFDKSPIGIMICDTTGKIVEINNAMLKSLGSTSVEKTRQINVFTFENLVEAGISKAMQDVLHDMKPRVFENEYQSVWGVKGFFRLFINVILDSKGLKQYIMLMAEDITDLHEKDLQLRQTEERFLDIYNNTSDLIYTMDFQGNFTSVNPVAEKWLGYKFEDLKNRNMSTFISHDSYKRAEEQIKLKLAHASNHSTYEVTAFTRTKEKMILEINSFLRYKNGNPIEVFGIARDITERKKHEDFITSALRERERLIMEVHHRVKNNMQLIVSMLKMYSYTYDNERVMQTFRDIIQKIMAISAAHEDFYFSIDFKDIEFENYLQTVVVNAIEQFDSQNRVLYSIEADKLDANIDEVIPLGLIVSELLSNSIRYGVGSDGHVNLLVGLRNNGKRHELFVSDKGPGIPAEIINNIGQSLGLSLVTMLAENQLGGSIKIDTSESGTTVTVEF